MRSCASVGLAVALGMVACADGPRELDDRCQVAEEAVIACNGAAADGFYEACEAAGPEDQPLIDALVAASCPSADELADASDENVKAAFAVACSSAVLSAELVTRQRNANTVAFQLPRRDRELLDDYFGSLAHDVRVHFFADLINKWVILGKTYELGDVYAQTFGDHIYVGDAYKPSNEWQRSVMAHELQHSQQARDAGSLQDFAIEYCLAFWDSGFEYETNAMEEEARAVQADFRACLSDGIDCPD